MACNERTSWTLLDAGVARTGTGCQGILKLAHLGSALERTQVVEHGHTVQMAVCLQHEIDHLHGVTMIDHLSPTQRMAAMRELAAAKAAGARPGETE